MGKAGISKGNCRGSLGRIEKEANLFFLKEGIKIYNILWNKVEF